MNDIGARLREVRIKKGLTQGQLAEKLQCSDKAISRYEKNENLDKVYDFINICEFLDDINYIITGKKYSGGKEISQQDQQILSAYHNLNNSDKQKIGDFILEIGEYDATKIIDFPQAISNAEYVYVCPQKASAGIGKIEDESNPDLKFIFF